METLDTLHSLFEARVAQTPDAIAVLFADQSLTYNELNKKANQLAHYLQTMGVKPETRVALCMDRSIELIITFFGILKAGGAYVSLDPSHPEQRLLFTLNDNETPILIIKSELKEKFAQYQGPLIILENSRQQIINQATHNPVSAATTQNLAYIIYTSGSTGRPKGVLIEHQSVINYSHWFADYCSCYPQQRIDFSSNYIFDMSVSVSVVPLMLGLTIVICNDEEKKNIRQYLKLLEYNKVNIIKITPGYFKAILHEIKNHPINLPHLQTIILGGENLSTVDCSIWLETYPQHILFNEYGPTEATVAVSQFKICSENVSSLGVNVPIGTPGPGMFCSIVGPDNYPVPDGEAGELCIGGVCLARGYLNQPELTQKQFITPPLRDQASVRLYKTGDLSRRLPDSVIEYLGRLDNQVKIRGFRIEPGEIEQLLREHPGIEQTEVLIQEQKNEKRLVAYYILKNSNNPLNARQLRNYLKTSLPDYMIPTAFVSIEHFPLTANGKLDRAELPVPHFTNTQHYLAPSTNLEKTLATIWSEELDIKPIGLTDDFFELGGHSLAAARIISQINNTLNKDITLNDFYLAPTVATLVTVVINGKSRNINSSSYDETNSVNSTILPLSDFQFLLWISNTFEPKVKKLNVVARKCFQGRLDIHALNFAFKAVIKKHEPLSYQISKFCAEQKVQKDSTFKIIEKNIESLSDKDCQLTLENSFNELSYCYPWQTPLLIAKLFTLNNETTELQICMPHIISDETSIKILFSDLSKFYLLYTSQANMEPSNKSCKQNDPQLTIHPDKRYREYLTRENTYAQTWIDRDINFWEHYLNNTHLFAFPQESIIEDMVSHGFSWSTYLKIQEQELNNLQQFCARNHISITDGLCAVIALALTRCCDNLTNESHPIFMNIVKSTRDQQSYDNTMGCFLRIEPIKVQLDKKIDLATLAKQVHQAVIDTNAYQRCSSLIKLASIQQRRPPEKIIQTRFIKFFISVYTRLFRTPQLIRKILNLCGRVMTLKQNNNFLININIQSNFIATTERTNTDLFGLKIKNTDIYPYDLLKVNNVFDVCFIRDDNQNAPWVVISANLIPALRERIGKEILKIINSKACQGDENQI